MSTQQYYSPPNAYAPPRPPAQQRPPVQYNPAGYNPAQQQQQQPQQQPQTHGGYNPGVYYPHAGAPPGRTTPQPPPAGRGYVPYANLQGVIGGVNRSAATESTGEEAPPPYSPPQRGFNRSNHLSAPPLTVPSANGRPISAGPGQSTLYTPITPSPNTSYQPLTVSPMPSQPTRLPQAQPAYSHPQNQVGPSLPQPQVQQYQVPDQRRLTSPPSQYNQNSNINPINQPQQPVSITNLQYNNSSQQSNISMLAANTQQALAQPHLHQRPIAPTPPSTVNQSTVHNLSETYDSPPSPTSLQRAQTVATLPPTGARRERDSLPLRRPGFNTAVSEPAIPKSNSPPVPTAQTQPQPVVMGPPSGTNRASVGIPPPPPGPPPPQVVPRRIASESVSRTSTPVVYPGPASISAHTPTTAGGTKLPNGMPLPPPPGGAPPKPVMIQPAPLGKKRNKSSPGEISPNQDSSGSDNGMITPSAKTPKSPYGAYSGAGGGLPFRSTSTTNATTPGSSSFPNQPQSIMRSQKSSGDLASGGLRTTTPKDVRFVIPDDESEYGSTVDTDSRRNSILEENPSFVETNAGENRNSLASIHENSVLDGEAARKRFQETRKTSMAIPSIPSWGSDEKASVRDLLPPQPVSAPATDRKFYPTPTPPFSPSDNSGIHSLEGKMANLNTKAACTEFLPTPPITQQISQNPSELAQSHAYLNGFDAEDEMVDDLPPFYHEAINRHNDMILEEATATNDEKRLNVFVDFVMEEARMRGEMYNQALGVLGPGLQLFPTEDPQYMTPEQQAYEYERSQGSIMSSIRRTSTVKEQKSRALSLRRSGTVSNPMSPKEAPKRSSWFMTVSGVSDSTSAVTNPDGSICLLNGQIHYPEGVYPPEKSSLDYREQILSPRFSDTIDIEPLLAIVPAYPRQFSASDNSHPSLQKHRKAIASLKDLTSIQKIKFEFATSVPKVLDSMAAETRARKSQYQDLTQRRFNEGKLSYEEMDKMNAQFERDEGDRKAADVKKEFDRYQKEVMKPAHAELMQRVDQTTALVDEMQKDISFGSKASGTVREGPELLEILNLMRHAFEMREQLHNEINDLIADRNKRYKEVVIAPFINDGDAEHIQEAEEFFDEDGKRAKVESDKEALERATVFTEMMKRNVVRGVEKEVSDFWDIAPTLSDVIDKIPQDLSNFKPTIPEDEIYANPNYSRFPLLYLRTNLEYAGNSIYQHAQAQIRLLGFSLDLTVAWNNAKWALKDSERVMAGEEEQRTVWQLERQKKEEEVRQTKNEEEKLKTVREEWTESIGNKLNDIKKRLEAHLTAQGVWPSDTSK